MLKFTILGAGSTRFFIPIFRDCLHSALLHNAEFALYDIDQDRLNEAHLIAEELNQQENQGKATIHSYLAVKERRTALRGASFVLSFLQVGGDAIITKEFELLSKSRIPVSWGDTTGAAAAFHALRSAKVLEGIATDIKAVCPNAWFFNYSNPLALLTSFLRQHGVEHCIGIPTASDLASNLLPALRKELKLADGTPLKMQTAGVNGLTMITALSSQGKDLLPELRKRAEKYHGSDYRKSEISPVIWEILRLYGALFTGNPNRLPEFFPHFLRTPESQKQINWQPMEANHCAEKQLTIWKSLRDQIKDSKQTGKKVELPCYQPSKEQAVPLIESILTNTPCLFQLDILNKSNLPQLPADCIVEIPVLADGNGLYGCTRATLPETTVALCTRLIGQQKIILQAMLSSIHSRAPIYQAVQLDPLSSALLEPEEIRLLCNKLFDLHNQEGLLPIYK